MTWRGALRSQRRLDIIEVRLKNDGLRRFQDRQGTSCRGGTGDLTLHVCSAITGDLTLHVCGAVTGDLTLHVCGAVTGDLTLHVCGAVTGDLTLHVCGAVTGDLTLHVCGAVGGNRTKAWAWVTLKEKTQTQVPWRQQSLGDNFITEQTVGERCNITVTIVMK